MLPFENSQNLVKTKPLVVINKSCTYTHTHCIDIINTSYESHEEITEKYFNDFLSMINNIKYSMCGYAAHNKKSYEVINFIVKHSKNLLIKNWENIIFLTSDNNILDIIKNQHLLDNNLLLNLINSKMKNYNNHNFVDCLYLSPPIKIKSFEYVLMNMNLNEFSHYLKNINKNYINSCYVNQIDQIMIKFLKKHKNSLESNNELSNNILKIFIKKNNILKEIYPIIPNINSELKKKIFENAIELLDKNMIILILEKKDIVIDISVINKLVEKSYRVTNSSSYNSNKVAEIIDLLCEYGLVITKKILLILLEKGCYINNIEKHDITIDNDILLKCAEYSYYPYKFDIVPNFDVLKKECSKPNNFNTIKKLKEYGAEYTSNCLEVACSVPKNGKVIKYLINECGVNISDKCIEIFQETYKTEALDILINKYKAQNTNKNQIKNEKNINEYDKFYDVNKFIELNQNATMSINPKKIKNDEIIINTKDDSIEYELKKKIRIFFELKKKSIKYKELYELFLKYLIKNKLLIGKYFVINIELSNLLKISQCVIIDSNQIHNVLTYFIIPKKIKDPDC